MSFVQTLRTETAADHDAVDARFGALRLDRTADYLRFLIAHGRALPAVEAALANHDDLPVWRPRAGALAADLAALGRPLPAALPFVLDDEGARWGALYVIEGSRLGGQLLARGLPPAAPSAYLGAVHQRSEWRALLDALERQAAARDDRWRAAALHGARQTFALYRGALGD